MAEIIITHPEEGGASSITIIQDEGRGRSEVRRFDVAGDRWVLEGDILKWRNWLNFLGLHTRYRLTRLRSRYLRTTEGMTKPSTIYSLVENEDSPFWKYLYQYGPGLRIVSTVYGNAVFQSSGEDVTFRVYVGTPGFIVRKDE